MWLFWLAPFAGMDLIHQIVSRYSVWTVVRSTELQYRKVTARELSEASLPPRASLNS